MRFPARNLKPYCEPVKEADLTPGRTLFSVRFADSEMLVPEMEAIVFLGFDLEEGATDMAYFQDLNSYSAERAQESTTEGARRTMYIGRKDKLQHIFDYEHALDVLLACALRRKERKGG